MNIGDICNRNVAFATRDTSVPDIARLMRDFHVGNLVVIDERDGKRAPVGIVTDRDLVLEILAQNIPPESVSAGDFMSEPCVVEREQTEIPQALRLMKAKGVRRLPVVDLEGGLVGILTLDDIQKWLAQQFGNTCEIVEREQTEEKARRRPVTAKPA